MIDTIEIKNSHKLLIKTAYFISILMLAFPIGISVINSLQIDLGFLVGFEDNVTNLVFFLFVFAISNFLLLEIVIAIIFSFFNFVVLFLRKQREEVKLLLKFSILFRNLFLTSIWLAAFFLPVLFNWFPLLYIIANILTAAIFFLEARANFGGDLMAPYLFKQTSKVFFLFTALSLVFLLGGVF